MIHRRPTCHRSGAALIIALLILAGLMLLGLPFLFSQSSSLSGARSFQAAQAARIYTETARNLGAALATYTVTAHWVKDGRQLYTAIDQYLLNSPLAPVLGAPPPPPPTTNHTNIDPSSLGFNQTGTRVRIGLAIEDESGKLDANTLGPQGWSDLLAAVGIPDWDDDFVQINWSGTNSGPDDDQCGELANALVHHRLWKHSYTRLEELLDVDPQTYRNNSSEFLKFRKRLTRAELERLRPYLSFHNRAAGRNGLIDLGSVVYVDDPSQLTGPSTASFIPQQAWLDAQDAPVNDGTWAEAEETPKGDHSDAIIRRWLGNGTNADTWGITYNLPNKPAIGSGVFIQAPPPLNLHQLPQVLRKLPAYVGSTKPSDSDFPTVPLIQWYGQPGAPAANDLPLAYLSPNYTPDDTPGFGPPGSHQEKPRKAALTERQPLDICSGGVVTIEHAATVVDAAGNAIAQESRRSVIQAVPQENIIEQRWETQGQLQPLIDQRYGSRMVTWPRATNRVSDVQVADTDPATSNPIEPQTGVSFAPNPTLANTNAGHKPTHVAVEWQTKLGSGVKYPQATVSDDFQSGLMSGGSFTPPSPIQNAAGEGLFPDGIRLGSGTQLAYKFARDNKGPLVWNDPTGTPIDSTMGHRSLSVWIRPEADWTAGGVITIMEARPPAPTFNGLSNSEIVTDNGNTNYFGVLYDPKQNMLVAVYGTPGATYAPADAATANLAASWATPWTMAMDDPTTPGQDERCGPGPASSPLIAGRMLRNDCALWSPVYRPNLVMTCYKLGRRLNDTSSPVANVPEIGRWYHLQVTVGNGRPGGLGIILDGIAGTDVGLQGAKAYQAARAASPLAGPWPGDHLTIPSLVLTTALPSVDRPMSDPSTQLYVQKIQIEMPGFVPFDSDNYASMPPIVLDPFKTLSRRGSVLIGDEYIRYEDITQTPLGTNTINTKYFLTKCTRGDRQNSYTYSGNPLTQQPATENHAAGSRVIADGCRITPSGTNDLYQGSAVTVDSAGFVNGVYDMNLNPESVIKAKIQTPTGITAFPVNTTTFTVGPEFKKAPARGYCRITESNSNVFYAFFTYDSGSNKLNLTLSVTDPEPGLGQCADMVHKLPTGAYGNINDAKLIGKDTLLNDPTPTYATVTLISLEVTPGPGNMLLDAFQQPWGHKDEGSSSPHERPMFQIMDPGTGRCEWIRYTDIIQHNTGFYFIDRNAWNYNFVTADPFQRSRAQERTSFSQDIVFPAGSLILPVQTGMKLTATRGDKSDLATFCKLLAPGDLITFVPRDYAGQTPFIAAVRYAANDGYGTGAQLLDHNNDTVNGYFALTTAMPAGISRNSKDWEIVMGTGLNTQLDLTPLNPVTLKPSALPRLDAHEIGGSARLVFGAPDPERLPGGAPSGLVMSIDAPAAIAPKPGAHDPNATFACKVRRVIRGGACVDQINATNDLPIMVELDRPLFQDQVRMGLIEIGGEIFAWRRTTAADQGQVITALTSLKASFPGVNVPVPSGGDPQMGWSNVVTLVGRGLLGSAPRQHLMDLSPAVGEISPALQGASDGNLDHGPEAMRLPIGPVRCLLDDPLAPITNFVNNKWFAVSEDGTQLSTAQFIAPSVLVADPLDGALTEVVQLAGIDTRATISQWDGTSNSRLTWTNLNANKWITAPWLRGMYNTPTTTAWVKKSGGNGDVTPLLIGWWTRFPSALPHVPPSQPTDATAQIRSRVFPWVGFCGNLARARFSDTDTDMPFAVKFDASLATNTVLTDPIPNLEVEIRAMAGDIDGDRTHAGALEDQDPARAGLGDWLTRPAAQLPLITAWNNITPLFSLNVGGKPWNVAGQPNETNGVEVRISFRYKGNPSSYLADIARAANRSPLISGARLRCHAPLTVLSTEGAR